MAVEVGSGESAPSGWLRNVTAASRAAPKRAPLSIVLPVHNEAAVIGDTSATLLAGLPEGAEVVFVCNGCHDASFEILEKAVLGRAIVLDIPVASKAKAIRLGEQHITAFPRFFVDSDVHIRGDDIAALTDRLRTEKLDLIAPRIGLDLVDAGYFARAAYRFAENLPHMQGDAFHHVLGVSADLRACWNELPDVMSDDTFIEAHALPGRKRVAEDVIVWTRPPRKFWAYVHVRSRWERGRWQLERLGISVSRSERQKQVALRMLLKTHLLLPGLIYLVAKCFGLLFALRAGRSGAGWYTDHTSRTPRSRDS